MIIIFEIERQSKRLPFLFCEQQTIARILSEHFHNPKERMMKGLQYFVLSLVLLGSSGQGWAADGEILIEQSDADAGNLTLGDTAGFPITISLPGSYKLSGNLTMPSGKTGIVIATNSVTIDLNGFRIRGISPQGYETAISDNGQARLNITIRNGSVSAVRTGINLSASTQCAIEQVRFTNVGSTAVMVGDYSTVVNNSIYDVTGVSNLAGIGISGKQGQTIRGNTISQVSSPKASLKAGGIKVSNNSLVQDNAVMSSGIGISVGLNSTVSGNTVSRNYTGIQAGASSTVSNNTVSQNDSFGMAVNCPSTIIGNTAVGNTIQSITMTGTGCTRANNTPAP